ncbi:thiamine pyrophosphate-binding protein [Pseudorhodoplanes sp.]|uniref:thiamine pyrophosphate-binding protein n=1 Tax=Pseudorhodoplanes sp. TaxID=1934341 RepID=UPI003D10FC5E
MRRAWRIAHSDRPGPVHLDLAREVAEDPLSHRVEAFDTAGIARAAACKPQADAIEETLELMGAAKRPILWIGRGALSAYQSGQLKLLVERLGIPVLSTFNAMETAGAFGELSFGVLSRVGTSLTRQILAESDFVLCLGNSLNGVSTKRWTMKIPTFVQVDVRADQLSAIYNPHVSIIADAGAFCDDVVARLDANPLKADWSEWRNACHEMRNSWSDRINQAVNAASGEPISPIALMHLFAKLDMDDGANWSIDASNPGIWAHMLRFRNNARVLRPVNFSNMGFALGSAIGIALADRSKGVVNVLIGDGSMGMSLGELETIKRLRVPVRIFVMNDSSLSNIRQEVTYKFKRNESGFDFTDVRFDKIAEGFGIPAARISKLDELEAQLRSEPDEFPRLYDIVIDRAPSVWTDMV